MLAFEDGLTKFLYFSLRTNKLLTSWKGPHEVVAKICVLNYRIKMGKKVKFFHIHILIQYIEREDNQQTTDIQVCSVAVLDCTSEDTEGNMEELVESLFLRMKQ